MSLHSLRQPAAAAMIGAGVPLKAVATTPGHSSITITADPCGHLTPDVHRSALDALADALA